MHFNNPIYFFFFLLLHKHTHTNNHSVCDFDFYGQQVTSHIRVYSRGKIINMNKIKNDKMQDYISDKRVNENLTNSRYNDEKNFDKRKIKIK